MKRTILKTATAVWVATQLITPVTSAHAEDLIRVTYAGSMGVVMDKALGPTFAQQAHAQYQGQGQGAYGMARLLISKKLAADVFVSITPGPIALLQKAGLVDEAVPVASTTMVIAYNPKSRFAAALQAAAAGGNTTPWWKVLQSPGLRLGRSDPAVDPQGQNIIFTMMLAEKYYKQPGLAKSVLGDTENPSQVFSEGGLLSRLESGEIDASSGYESATRSAHLPFVALPDEINLSNPTLNKAWYDTVSFPITNAKGNTETLTPQPLVFYAAVLKNAPDPENAKAFVAFLQSDKGQALLAADGYGKPKGAVMRAAAP